MTHIYKTPTFKIKNDQELVPVALLKCVYNILFFVLFSRSPLCKKSLEIELVISFACEIKPKDFFNCFQYKTVFCCAFIYLYYIGMIPSNNK